MLLFAVLALLWLSAKPTQCVGPELKARARLMRDLSLSSGLQREHRDDGEAGGGGDGDGGGGRRGRKRRRTLIDMSLAIRSMDLDMETGMFRTDGWMSLRWRDSRYRWDPANYEGIEKATLPFSKIWAPEVILHNSMEEKFVYRQVGMVKHTGEFVYLIAVHTRSACQPNFDGFPFGMQTCRLVFGSWANEGYNVEYRIKDNETVALDDFSSPTGWKIVATEAHLESRQYPLFEEPSHTVVFDVAFKRERYFDKQANRVFENEEEYQEYRRAKATE